MSISPAPSFPSLALEATAFTKAQLIAPEAPQLALAGRSNVGKSSLVNALAGRKKLAKVSAAPGKTRSVNYYRIGKAEAFLVDLPGYGYAKCGKEERAQWARLIEHYLRTTPGLKALVLLLDSRLPPQQADRELLAFASGLGISIMPVLTKSDKCGKKELAACIKGWSAFLDAESLVPTSAEKRIGLERLWRDMLRRLELQTERPDPGEKTTLPG